MCNVLTPLVQQSFNRQVARCEHGTLHLSWHAVTWSLSGRDFARLYSFVQAALRSGQSHFEAPPMVFGRGNGGNTTLWSGPAGLAFTPDDFEAFYGLLCDTHIALAGGRSSDAPRLAASPFFSELN
ncbi:hypothetical protein [Deinococcus sp. UYEF24]